jgi:transposase
MGCAHRYILEKLRFSLCGEIISANPPKEMGEDKYDASFVAQLSIQKYYMGMPSYRQDCFHSFIDLPLPHTTHWMIYEKLAGCALPVFNQLCKMAANHWLLY